MTFYSKKNLQSIDSLLLDLHIPTNIGCMPSRLPLVNPSWPLTNVGFRSITTSRDLIGFANYATYNKLRQKNISFLNVLSTMRLEGDITALTRTQGAPSPRSFVILTRDASLFMKEIFEHRLQSLCTRPDRRPSRGSPLSFRLSRQIGAASRDPCFQISETPFDNKVHTLQCAFHFLTWYQCREVGSLNWIHGHWRSCTPKVWNYLLWLCISIFFKWSQSRDPKSELSSWWLKFMNPKCLELSSLAKKRQHHNINTKKTN